jgi:hypothetical protein
MVALTNAQADIGTLVHKPAELVGPPPPVSEEGIGWDGVRPGGWNHM